MGLSLRTSMQQKPNKHMECFDEIYFTQNTPQTHILIKRTRFEKRLIIC